MSLSGDPGRYSPPKRSSAGADVLYAPGPRSREDIAALVAAVALRPINVLMSTNTGLRLSDLADMGVRRVSVGSALAMAAWTGLLAAAIPMAKDGSFAGLEGAVRYAEINGLFREEMKRRS